MNDHGQDRFEEKVQAWFATGEGDVALGQVQIPRGDLQDMWLWTMIHDTVSELENLGNRADETNTLETIRMLTQIRAAIQAQGGE